MPVCGKDGVPSDPTKPTTTGDSKTETTEKQTDTDGDGVADSTESGSEKTERTTTCIGESCTTTTKKETTNPDGSKTVATETTTETKRSFCQENPASEQCQQEEIKPGDGAVTEGLYTKGDRTPLQVFTEFGTKVRSASFFTGASNFFTVSVPAGACSDLSATVDYGLGQMTVDMTPVFCSQMANNMYSLLRIGVMIAALWVAFRIALL